MLRHSGLPKALNEARACCLLTYLRAVLLLLPPKTDENKMMRHCAEAMYGRLQKVEIWAWDDYA